ncbi:MAG: putative RDD family membrane protein YckC [Patiriisocius sp.]|jgi:uncharacterized RDD family membrane protein YckC
MSLDDQYIKQTTEYAGFFRRFVAFMIDQLIILIPLFLFGLDMDDYVESLGFLVIMWLYYALMESSERRGTIGKMVMSIVVTDMDGYQLNFTKASIRFFGKILSSLFLFLGYIIAVFHPRRQALHDIISNSLVLKV